MKPQLTIGCLAYYDSAIGLVPCKVLRIHTDPSDGTQLATVKLTATRKAYYRGEVCTFGIRNVVPRKAIHVKDYKYVIWPYDVVAA